MPITLRWIISVLAFKDTQILTEDLRIHRLKEPLVLPRTSPHTHTCHYLKQVFWTRPKRVRFLKFNQQQVYVRVRVWDSGCMWLLVCARALTNNHLSKPDQRLSLRFRSAALAGERRAITKTPQTNRLHNFSVTNNHWGLSPYPKWNLSHLCRCKDTKEFLMLPRVRYESPWW